MKIILTENRRNNIVIKWLDDNYGDLIGMENSHGIVYYKKKDGTTIFTFRNDYGIVTIEDDELQQYLVSIFSVDSHDLNKIFIPWIEENYNQHVTEVTYTTWHCNECGKYHLTKYHIN
jgi:hypothetical protein